MQKTVIKGCIPRRYPRFARALDNLISFDYVDFFNSIDRRITTNLIDGEIVTRPVTENGLWCIILIPAVLLGYNFQYAVSPVYGIVTYIALGLLIYGCLLILFLSISSLALKESIFGGCVACSMLTALMIYAFLDQDLTYSFLLSSLAIYGYTVFLRNCIIAFPRTFTLGEAMIVSQAVVLYVVMTVAKMFDTSLGNPEMDLVIAIVNTVLATVGLIVTAIYLMSEEQKKNINNFFFILTGAALFAFIMVQLLLGFGGTVIVINYVFNSYQRIQLLSFWAFLVVISVCVLLLRTQLAVKADTVTRKTFHILASLVFLTGVLFDVYLITLASGIGLGLMIFVEAIRLSKIEPMSSALQSAFLIYCDDKDCGAFAMTPLYLYCGLACPLLLVPAPRLRLELLAGVLAVGVGDTAASWFGSRYGFNKWPNSSKSIEGTTFNVLAQVGTVYALQIFELLESAHGGGVARTALAAALSALVEARTQQVDNLLLPLVTLLSFHLTAGLGAACACVCLCGLKVVFW